MRGTLVFRRLNRLRRPVMWTGCALAFPFLMHAAPIGWTALQTRGELAGWQTQCMLHCRPAQQLVYADDRATVEKLLPMAGYEKGRFDRTLDTDARSFIAMPAECWTNLTRLANPLDEKTRVPLFLHERVAGDVRRLVAIALENRRDFEDCVVLTLGCYRMEPASALDTAALECVEQRLTIACKPAACDVRFFAGRVDPANPSRFTIDYEAGGEAGVIEGALASDDSIVLRVTGLGTLH
jgi:hypothetical protein